MINRLMAEVISHIIKIFREKSQSSQFVFISQLLALIFIEKIFVNFKQFIAFFNLHPNMILKHEVGE